MRSWKRARRRGTTTNEYYLRWRQTYHATRREHVSRPIVRASLPWMAQLHKREKRTQRACATRNARRYGDCKAFFARLAIPL